MARLVTKTDALPDGARRIGVIADTHSAPHPNTAELLAARKPDAIVHAGDIGDHAVLDRFRDIAPLYAIRGNIDAHGLPDVLALGDILVIHIGVNGPHLRPDAAKLARDHGAKLVVCGHSHVPFVGLERGLAVFNPGSCGPRRFHLPIVFGMIELADKLRFSHVDCETGQAWMPP